MKIKPKLDRRSKNDYQKIHDDKWVAVCRKAKRTIQQQLIIGQYLDSEILDKIEETTAAVKYGSYIYLHDNHGFGKDRMTKFNDGVTEIVNEAYNRECVDANGRHQEWDGCGIEHLQNEIKTRGIDLAKI